MSWEQLGSVAPLSLSEARLEAHYAAQVVAAAAITLLEPTADDGHPNLGWSDAHGSLMGRPLPPLGAQVGLRIADLTLVHVDSAGGLLGVLVLENRSMDEAYAWLSERLRESGADLPAEGIVRSPYELPSHELSGGKPFAYARPDAFAELAAWFANGFHALDQLAKRVGEQSEVRCWPHHFDVGGLSAIETDSDGNLSKSIGFGLSPGDLSYAEPYWYVSPWPYPDSEKLPPLGPFGQWHIEGFTSAILVGSDLTSVNPEPEQELRVSDFLDSSMAASLRILVAD